MTEELLAVNNFNAPEGSKMIEEDILYCYCFYVEPAFKYELQASYWENQPKNLMAMAHDVEFRREDERLTLDFLEDFTEDFTGDRVLDICGGIGRYGKLLKVLFSKIDLLDLKPSFGDIPVSKQGKLMPANLRDIDRHISYHSYDCIFGNWALSYIGYEAVSKVLACLYMGLKPGGTMILKETILEEYESTPRLCPTGQWMITRPVRAIEQCLMKNFDIVKSVDIRQ